MFAIEGIVIQLLKSFIERQLAKFGSQIDWEKVKADFSKRAEDLLPGTQFDAIACFIAETLIDLVSKAFSNPAVQNVDQAFNIASQGLHVALAGRALQVKGGQEC